MADLILFMFTDHTPQMVNQYMLIPFTLRQLLVTTTYQWWSGEARNLQRGPEITVKVKMQSQEPRGGSGVSPPRKFSSFTWWNDEFWCVFWIQFSFSLTFPWLCHILSIFPDFPWPPKFPDLFQFSLTCRNPGLSVSQVKKTFITDSWLLGTTVSGIQKAKSADWMIKTVGKFKNKLIVF